MRRKNKNANTGRDFGKKIKKTIDNLWEVGYSLYQIDQFSTDSVMGVSLLRCLFFCHRGDKKMLPVEIEKKFNNLMQEARIRESIRNDISVSELSEILNVDKTTVRKTVKRLEEKIGADVLHHLTLDEYGNECWRFDEKQATVIKQEIQKHHNLANRDIDDVSTPLEENQIILKAMEILAARAERYKLELMQVRADYDKIKPVAEKLLGSSDLLLIRDVSKILAHPGFGEKNLFKLLREKNVLNSQNIPYQRYVDNGYFKLCETSYVAGEKIKIGITTKVTQKGILFINKLIELEA